MKSKLLILIALPVVALILVGCAEEESGYTYLQEKAFKSLNRTFWGTTDYDSEEYGPYSISFETFYERPVLIKTDYYIDEKLFVYEVHGECYYVQYVNPFTRYYFDCYYSLSDDARQFTLYYRGGLNHKKLLKKFDFHLVNQKEFRLKDTQDSITYYYRHN